MQGTAYPDPATRYALRSGILSQNETIPMWGGVAIYELIPSGISGNSPNQTGNSKTLGPVVGRATGVALTGSFPIAGFSVFDQAYGMINTPQSPVQLAASGMQVMSYRFGSGARIAVACSAGLSSLNGSPINKSTLVSWDFVAQELVPYTPAYTATTLTGATWANTAGGQITYTGLSQDLSAVLAAGDIVDVSGVVSTGGTGVGYNGNYVVVSVTSSTLVVTFAAASSPGTYSSGGTIAAGGGALPVSVLDIQTANCQTVTYNATTGFATWNYNGACAVIQI